MIIIIRRRAILYLRAFLNWCMTTYSYYTTRLLAYSSSNLIGNTKVYVSNIQNFKS